MLGVGGCASTERVPAGPAVPSVISAIWSEESGGLCVTLSGTVSAGPSLLPGGEFELRLSGPSLEQPIFRVPNARGRTCFELARTPAEFGGLRPGPVSVDAMVAGRITQIASARLDEPTIRRLAAAALERGRQRTGAPGPGGTAEISLRTVPDRVAAGETVRIVGTATNTGDRPLYRLSAAVVGQGVPAGEATLDFGWLQPGETIELTQTVRVERGHRADSIELDVQTAELHGAAIAAAETVRLAVQPLPPAAIRTEVTVTPDRHGRAVREGREDTFRPGDDLHMVVEVTNFGDTDLLGGVAELRSPEPGNASVRVGRAVLGNLPPGGSTRAHFWFIVRAPLGSARMPMLVEISDTDLGVVHEQAVVIEIDED
ncbi:MAG: hypothetical protein AAGF47_00515 [Planctomycetota bacterium]